MIAGPKPTACPTLWLFFLFSIQIFRAFLKHALQEFLQGILPMFVRYSH